VTDQLGGTIELDRTRGTAFKIIFRGSKEAKYGEG
jgi:two-component sensor histidine kinase